MTKEEVKKCFEVLKTADGGCSSCVPEIIKEFVSAFPEHKEDIKELLVLETGYPLEHGAEFAREL
jgi:predicted fused transcriptional regulator/phosphomethylpyrimidine kinase